jgi:HEPN domain-containing protein
VLPSDCPEPTLIRRALPTIAGKHKALKAVIAGTGDAIPKTHDLRVPLGRYVAIDRSLDQFYDWNRRVSASRLAAYANVPSESLA